MQLHERREDRAAALRVADELVERWPEEAEFRRQRVRVRLHGTSETVDPGELERLRQDLAEAGRLSPGDPRNLVAESYLLVVADQPEAAIDALTRALQLDPKLVEAWRMRGFIRAQVGDRRRAREDLEQFLRVSGNDPRVVAWARDLLDRLDAADRRR